ncbi:helix-turn-helix domain-containing protein [Listeria booriae]|uniref:helix-turn-helix domain-containing protein n=1 Tax=Listeria booriae TaxID=1552123 RepID=UPI0016293E9F|nr:helix-turn-helix domain-containing protein [Listeria booriae]MBC2148124.1 DnaD domain protein [Listeria booriae]
MSELLEVHGIFAQGYGMIAKMVMRDKDLSIEAKGIYSYLCSFAGAGAVAFPSIELMCAELGMSTDRFYTHRKKLVQKGYIIIVQRRENGKQLSNIYQIPNYPQKIEEKPQPENQATEDEAEEKPYPCFPATEIPVPENPIPENKETINNSLINNSFINNNLNNNSNTEAAAANSVNNISSVDEKVAAAAVNPFTTYQVNIGTLNAIQTEAMLKWVEETDAEFVNYAVERAALRGAYSYSLVDSLLSEWTKANIADAEKAKAYEMQKERRKGGGYRGKQPDESAGRYQSKDRYKT